MAVKVRRPGIDTQIEADVAVLRDLAALAERHLLNAELFSLGDLVEEFARIIAQPSRQVDVQVA